MKITACLVLLTGILASCAKTHTAETTIQPTSIDFSGLPVKSVQEHVKGRWELRRITGGIAGQGFTHPVRNHPYMTLSADHLVLGDDSLGVFVDAPITWGPATYFGSGYVLSTPNDAVQLVPLALRNDTLLMQQYAADGLTYQYTR